MTHCLRALHVVTLATLFAAAPMQVIPLLNKSSRLDLVDYYEAGMEAKVENRLKGTTSLTHLSDTLIVLQMTPATSMEIRLQNDSTIEITNLYHLPDSEMKSIKRYSTSWELKQ